MVDDVLTEACMISVFCAVYFSCTPSVVCSRVLVGSLWHVHPRNSNGSR